MTLYRAAVISAGILLALATQPAHAGAGDCDDWASKRSRMAGFGKYFEVEGAHRENLVGNFNLAPPQTRLAPDIVGYSWGGGGDFARLYLIEDGCVVAERLYPMKLVWRMMGSYPAVPLDMDKSGERYLRELEERQALHQKLQAQALESERQASEAGQSNDPGADPDNAIGDDQIMQDMD
jgi:hypothetical protein